MTKIVQKCAKQATAIHAEKYLNHYVNSLILLISHQLMLSCVFHRYYSHYCNAKLCDICAFPRLSFQGPLPSPALQGLSRPYSYTPLCMTLTSNVLKDLMSVGVEMNTCNQALIYEKFDIVRERTRVLFSSFVNILLVSVLIDQHQLISWQKFVERIIIYYGRCLAWTVTIFYQVAVNIILTSLTYWENIIRQASWNVSSDTVDTWWCVL